MKPSHSDGKHLNHLSTLGMVQNKGSLSLSMLNGWTFHPLQKLQLKSTEARLARYQKAEQFMGCKIWKLSRSPEKGCKVISFFSVRQIIHDSLKPRDLMGHLLQPPPFVGSQGNILNGSERSVSPFSQAPKQLKVSESP
jgi:hypothetical protein